jgi:diguanylate cyclase (GGDEF)-like protein/PAS domain S-box-containing protein
MTGLRGVGMNADGTLSATAVGKLAAGMWMVSSLLVVSAELLAPGHTSRFATVAIGLGALFSGMALWVLPWCRWPRSVTLWLVPLTFATIGLDYRLADGNGFLYAITFLMVFAWLGLAHPRGTSLKFAPLLIVAYVIPLLGGPAGRSSLGLASAVYVVPCCVMVGEAVAWGMALLADTEWTLTETQERNVGIFEQAPMGIAVSSLDGGLIRVNAAYAKILGYRPEELVGKNLQEITHPDDWTDTSTHMAAAVAGDVEAYTMEKRYVRADGHMVWASVGASCVRDRAGEPLYLIAQIEDITERHALRDKLAYAAVHDQLTGLPNRTMFMDRLERLIVRAERRGRHVALMFLDLDRFKLINDGLGHDAGDRLLQRVALRLQASLRADDLLARFGGDEFTLLCEVASEEEAVEIARRLGAVMDRPLTEANREQFISLSVGIALSSAETTHPTALLRNADVAMYRAKDLGPARIALYSEDDELPTVEGLRITNELHRALERSEFVLHYQPIVDLHDLRLVGMEALVRWQHPTRGLLGPGEFIPLAEDSGLIVPLGTWVLREACRQAAVWAVERAGGDQDNGRLNMSINVAARQLADPAFPELVAAAIDDSGFWADHVWLEITEGAILSDPVAAVVTLGRLRDLGVQLSIDDFGTGYSSLSYLKQLPVETLKIDRSFIDQLDEDPDDKAIVRAVIALGDSLGLAVIAEGIERSSQADELTALGCHLAQGFLYGRPMSPAAIGSFPNDDLVGWPGAADLTNAR